MNQTSNASRGRYLPLYLTAEHDCAYLDGFQARTLFVDPTARIDGATYRALVDQGFRRSGSHVYRPACRSCARCVPVRIPVEAFRADRSQRRNWKQNHQCMTLIDTPAAFKDTHFSLYRRYLAHRHSDSGMVDDLSEASYRRFLVEPWGGSTRFIEIWLEQCLVGVAVTDRLENGLSAVYTFFDPDLAERGPGTFAVLAQIETARTHGLGYLFLGYWIRECRKMAYKERFRPIEAWDGRQWRRFERNQPLNLSCD